MKTSIVLALVLLASPLAAGNAFLEKPYLQLGGASAAQGSLNLLWHAPDKESAWVVELQGEKGAWRAVPKPVWTRVAVASIPPHRVYTANLAPLAPGVPFTYRVKQDGKTVFQARGMARKGPGQAQRVAVMGDLARGGPDPKAIAFHLHKSKPDLIVVPGDMVYQDGRISEYRKDFFPVYNADVAEPALGAPLMRSSIMVGVLGNHDVGEYGPKHPHSTEPDSLAYYLYWDQPLNGPKGVAAPPLMPFKGWSWQPFLDAAGPRFPTMGTFSFRSGDAHFTVLDSNIYTRWDTQELRDWLEKDLADAQDATWRFVLFHHPVFNANMRYAEMWMGQLWPLFQKYGVDIVLTGHVHCYQRTLPIRFTPAPDSVASLDPVTRQGYLKGDLAWDTEFDGKKVTKPKGIIQVITGAGGANLHYKGRAIKHAMIRAYVDTYVLDTHSYSLMDIDGKRLDFRQVDIHGNELDHFTVTK